MQVAESGQLVIGLGQIATRTANGQQLALVLVEESLELLIVRFAIQHLADGRIVAPGEEMHPEHFLEGLRALRSNFDGIAVRPFLFPRRRERQARVKMVPPVRRPHPGVVAVAMGGEAGQRIQHVQQDGAARARHAADPHRCLRFEVADAVHHRCRFPTRQAWTQATKPGQQRGQPTLSEGNMTYAMRHGVWDSPDSRARTGLPG
jgi:hypothetical protein